jgi:hypothetical protein
MNELASLSRLEIIAHSFRFETHKGRDRKKLFNWKERRPRCEAIPESDNGGTKTLTLAWATSFIRLTRVASDLNRIIKRRTKIRVNQTKKVAGKSAGKNTKVRSQFGVIGNNLLLARKIKMQLRPLD